MEFSFKSSTNSDELLEILGIQNLEPRDFAPEKGSNPHIKESEKKNFEKFRKRCSNKSSIKVLTSTSALDDYDEDKATSSFDLKSKPRTLLYEGKVQKRSYSGYGAMVAHTSTRQIVLLNDVFMICSINSSSAMQIYSSPDKLVIHQVFYLDTISICDMKKLNPEEDPCVFAVITEERPYQFIADTPEEKDIWLEELEDAIMCIMFEKQVWCKAISSNIKNNC